MRSYRLGANAIKSVVPCIVSHLTNAPLQLPRALNVETSVLLTEMTTKGDKRKLFAMQRYDFKELVLVAWWADRLPANTASASSPLQSFLGDENGLSF